MKASQIFVASAMLFVVASNAVSQTKPLGPPKDKKEEQSRFATMHKAQSSAKAAYSKKKTDSGLRSRYIEWTMTLADNYTFAKFIDSKDKYPKALKYYREVLQVDPKNKEAKNWVDIIESIYKKRGTPVPKV